MVRFARLAALGALAVLVGCRDPLAPPPTALVVTATQVSLQAQAGAPGVAEATVDLSAADGRTLEAPTVEVAYQDEPGWLDVRAAPLGQAWRVTLRATGGALTAGHHAATVTLGAAGAAGPTVVEVGLDVAPAPPTLVVSASAVAFEAEQGGADPAPRVLEVRLEGGSGPAPTAEVLPAGAAPWLAASIEAAAGGWSLTLAASVAGLAPGVHLATVAVASAGATGSPAEVAVAFTVGPTTAALAVAPASLAFTTTEGTAPAAQVLSAFAPTTPALEAVTVAVDPPEAAAWLTFSTALAGDHVEIAVQPDVGGLAPGSYAAALVVESPGLLDSPARVPVALTVDPAIPALQASPLAVQFDSSFNNPPPAQTIAVTGVGLGVLPPVTVATTIHAGSGWLQATVGGAGNAQTVRLQATPSGLRPGTYGADVVITAEGAAGSPATVAVTLYILSTTGSRCPPGSTLAYLGGGGGAGGAEPADFASTFFGNYCTRCHDSNKVGLDRNGALPGTDFDTLAHARAVNLFLLDVYAAAGPNGDFSVMPPAGLAPTLQERTWLGEWIACGEP